MKDWVTAQQAALELGVSTSTLKRFCDKNEIPLTRTPGGHRRIDRCHLLLASQLIRKGVQSDLPSQGPDNATTLRLLLAAEDSDLIELFWRDAHSPSRLIELLEEVLVPSLWHVGVLRSRDELETAEETVCTSTAAALLDGIFSRMPPAGADAVVYLGATFPSSLDTIAEKLVAIALRSIGAKPINLGCSVHPEVIARAAHLHNAAAVCISHTHIKDVEMMIESHQRLAECLPDGCRVIIGGGDLSPSIRRRLEHCTYYETVSMLATQEAARNRVAPRASST
jgi:excisionase family DNA binding protein